MGSQNAAKQQLEAVAGRQATYYPFGDYRGLPPTQTLTDRGFTGQKSNNQPAANLGLLYYNLEVIRDIFDYPLVLGA